MPSAIVVGATGILGRAIVHSLSKDKKQWSTIHALSRSKKEDFADNVVHNHIDLTSSASEMSKDLEKVHGEYVFFAAYLQKDTEQENWDVNGDMLANFLEALDKTGNAKSVKRIILVTGAKQYGVHLGPVKLPMLESDPELRDSKWPPNFYYRQQDILHKFCAEKNIEWVVTYPNDVIGFAVGNFMNLATSVALYALVTKELGQDLAFPGSQKFYGLGDCFTYAPLHGDFCAWAALEPKAKNQAFNVVNGDVECWLGMWPRLADYFGLKVKVDQFTDGPGEDYDNECASVMDMHDESPLSAHAARSGLVGTQALTPGRVEARIDLTKWSQRDDVKNAWKAVSQREGLDESAFEKATWGFLGFVLGRNFELNISMSKAREAGWMGYKDTWGALEDVFGELEGGGILPRRR